MNHYLKSAPVARVKESESKVLVAPRRPPAPPPRMPARKGWLKGHSTTSATRSEPAFEGRIWIIGRQSLHLHQICIKAFGAQRFKRQNRPPLILYYSKEYKRPHRRYTRSFHYATRWPCHEDTAERELFIRLQKFNYILYLLNFMRVRHPRRPVLRIFVSWGDVAV